MKNRSDEKYQQHVRETAGDYAVKRNRMFDNIAKVVTLVIAIILWLYVGTSVDVTAEETFDMIPLTVQGGEDLEAQDLAVLSMSYDTLNVTLKGTRSALSSVTNSNLTAYVDLSGIDAANVYTLPVSFKLPSGVTLAKEPADVVVTVDRLDTCLFAVDGSLFAVNSWMVTDSCYIDFDNATADVDYLLVEAPSLLMSKVASVRIVANTAIPLTGTSDLSASVEVIDAAGNALTDTQITVKAYQGGVVANGSLRGGTLKKQISVHIPVVKEKTVPVVLTDSEGILSSAITMNPATVLIKGSPEAVDAVSSFDLGSFSAKNIVNAENGVASLYCSVKALPQGITSATLADGSAFTTAVAQVAVGGTYELTVPRSLVTVVGGEALLVDDVITLTVRTDGDETYFLLLENNIAAGKGGVSLVVNLTDMDLVGEIEAPVTVIFSAEYEGKVYEIYSEDTPYTATVRPIE